MADVMDKNSIIEGMSITQLYRLNEENRISGNNFLGLTSGSCYISIEEERQNDNQKLREFYNLEENWE